MSTTITEFNAGLVATYRRLAIREYLFEANARVYQEQIADFADDLLDLIQKDECCVSHDRLAKYHVLSPKNLSGDTARLMEQHELRLGTDYILSEVAENQGPGRPKKSYLLHPDAFELCLMRAKNTRRYARFYSLLRKIVAGYDKYQLALAQAQNVRTSVENTELKVRLTRIEAQNTELLTEVGHIRSQNDNLLIAAEEILGSVDEVREVASSYASEAVVRPPTGGKVESFALVSVADERGETQLCVIRCQSRGVAAQVSKHKRRVQDEAKARARQAAAAQGLGAPEQVRRALRAAAAVRARTEFAVHGVPNVRYLWDRIQRDAGERLEVLPGTPARVRLHGISMEELETLARQINTESAAKCEEVTAAVKEGAAQALIQVNTGPVTVNNVQIVVAAAPSKLTDEDLEALLTDYLR